VKRGAAGLESWLKTTGMQNVSNVKEVLKSARPWYAARSMQGATACAVPLGG
jgi:hypothetical protein